MLSVPQYICLPNLTLQQIRQKVAEKSYTVFVAVPTIYVKIPRYLDTLDDNSNDWDVNGDIVVQRNKSSIFDRFRAMRLNVSGSAACPFGMFQDLAEIHRSNTPGTLNKLYLCGTVPLSHIHIIFTVYIVYKPPRERVQWL